MIVRQRLVLGGLALFAAIVAALPWFFAAGQGRAGQQQFALGRDLYATHCAGCHGASLEGQPNWEVPLPNGKMPAPPLNGTGHAPHHSHAQLFQIVKGGMASVNGGEPTDMPAFQSVLSEDEIQAVLAFIESSW